MAKRCDLEQCSLKEDIDEIKKGQNELVKTTVRLVQRVDDYIERGDAEHKALFKRTSMVVKWPHLIGVVTGGCAIIGVIFGILRLAHALGG